MIKDFKESQQETSMMYAIKNQTRLNQWTILGNIGYDYACPQAEGIETI